MDKENKKNGRPPMYGQKMILTAIYLTEEMREWIAQQPGESMSETIRNIIETNMNMRNIK
jgi:hypothetical protein